MKKEILQATAFLSSFLPFEYRYIFENRLFDVLSAKFQGHWNAKSGSAYRSLINMNGVRFDPVIMNAFIFTGLPFSDFYNYFTIDFVMWIDPDLVVCRFDNRNEIVLLDNVARKIKSRREVKSSGSEDNDSDILSEFKRKIRQAASPALSSVSSS
ncbi:hypothetical protein ROZALSC1DRAFT_20054 [Rozella allomycis CSF55]|uniref:Anti-proliferative protein domain-containing protein n=1 Tax=Rozella allomycis (strain CSF55) TaxID=988480 RepID=A0A4P9YQM1_ROZAC|nr:hypothetical protein ROZALSC1DRAFT_20049 [Rozella allomycis CSF55]RKP22005.1 hypothetical protein ROZALSC1DRAFT_20054 [Rozella allomycis CSF55]